MFLQEVIPDIQKGGKLEARVHIDSPFVYYGTTLGTPASVDMINQMNNSDYKEEIIYINNTFKPVTVTTRNGLCVTIPYHFSSTSTNFIVRKIITLKNSALLSATSAVNSLTSVDGQELQELKRVLNNIENGNFKVVSIMLDLIVTLDQIESRGGSVYHYESDAVLSFESAFNKVTHPYSPSFINIGAFGKTIEYGGQRELNIKMRMVDHSPNAKRKYINLAGCVFELKPQKDYPAKNLQVKGDKKQVVRNYDSYLEMFYSANSAVNKKIGVDGVSRIKMTIEEAMVSIGLYDTFEEAECIGDPESRNKKTLMDLVQQIETLKHTSTLEKLQHERVNTNRKEELGKLEHEITLLKTELARSSQELESKTHALQMEVLKQKERNTELEGAFVSIENEKKKLKMLEKEQDERLEKERKAADDIIKRNRDELDHKLKVAKDEHEENVKKTREKAEQDIRQNMQYWKDHYEMRSTVRKDTSEFSKFLPGLLIGVVGIVGTVLKYRAEANAA